MSIQYNPSIITNGLVLYTDMSNTQKSWKGAPTTNLVNTPVTTYGGWTTVGQWSQHPNGTGYGVMQTTLADNTSGSVYYATALGSGLYGWNTTVYSTIPNGSTTISVWVKLYSATTGTMVIRSNDTGGNLNYVDVGTLTTMWQRKYVTYTHSSSNDIMITLTGNNVMFYGLQVESKAVMTTYITGSRSNTQSLLDLAGQNSITANSLTYNSDGSYSFNGTGDYITVNRTLSSPMTISGFIKYTDQAKSMNTFFNSYPHTVLAISVNRNGAGQLAVYIGNGTTWIGTPSISAYMAVNTWYHVAFTTNGVTSDLYLNGVNVGTSAQAPSGWGNYFTLGMLVQSLEYFKGNIASTQIYNRVLSALEIQQNFNAHRSRYSI
jgi:hypothetical protein